MNTDTNIKQRVKARKGTRAGQLLRNGALAGQDPLEAGRGWYQLSEHYTRLAHQRGIDPAVKVVCTPEAGAGRYGIYLASANRIGLEGKILPVAPEVLNQDNAVHFQALATLHGVFESQVAHVLYGITERPYMGLDTAEAFEVLEAIRVEARAVRERPESGQWMRAAIKHLLLNQLTGPFYHNSLEMAAAATLVEGRVLAGVLTSDDVAAFTAVADQTMDADKRADLADLWRDALTVADGDTSGMWDLAARMSELFPRNDVRFDDWGPVLSEALAQVAQEAMTEAMKAMENDEAALMEVAEAANEPSLGLDEDEYDELEETLTGLADAGHASQSGYAVWTHREAREDERRARVVLSQKFKKARMRDRTNVKYQSENPGGRLRVSEAMREAADRALGRFSDAKPWNRKRRQINELPMLKLGILVDLSGSMASFMKGVSSANWILFNAARDVQGDVMTCSFGDTAEVLVEPRKAMPRVMNLKANGGTDHIGVAALKIESDLDFDRGPRILAIISDGGWAAAAAHNEIIDRMRKDGVIVVIINIKKPGAEQSCDWNIVVDDPMEIATVLGDVCEQALAEAID